ncbi:hypothetical protein DI09_33p130 [Mitosporidium daphniae]|uniref:TM7S3/TM198-like domain-containing protein n=1 Tax=Mitosporidium daphniae TaxID=1485682 RepID=A0A098VUW8_9MICR|nr:uncharacterized protein DI09_33p130 [Mitosporidium daphniae]KGG51496.1 hypothetical protein DI09_33p130 [Mitosporidium daphniae]|eukprot:XP_013237923.1 uncharacterized protein DI09_33p130 [Mitosporidium daphniae]
MAEASTDGSPGVSNSEVIQEETSKILFVIGASAGALSAYTILLNIEKSMTDTPLFGDARTLAFAGICLGCALLFGALALALWKLGLLISGGLGGLALGMFLLSLPPINSFLIGESGSSIVRPILLAVTVCIGGLMSIFYESVVIMASTALFGAGCICTCIDIYAKTGFDEAIRTILQNKGSVDMNSSFAGLLISYGVLFLIGFYLQYKGQFPSSSRRRHALVADDRAPVYKV